MASVQLHKIDAIEEDYLYVQPSSIENSGNGLFTAIDIYKDEIISLFDGEILSDLEAKKRAEEGNDQYFINMLDGRIMDSKHVDCFAKYANDAEGLPNPKFKNNSDISLDDDNNICLVATFDITAGSEIFTSYGKKYWKKHLIQQ